MAPASIDQYCAVWNEPDPNRRASLLAEVWAPGGCYTDPMVHACGAEALLAHIANIQAQRPGARIERVGAVELHHDVARFSWRAVRNGDVLRQGIDIAIFTTDGRRIERMIGFFDPLESAPA
jgi:hypothetical protein